MHDILVLLMSDWLLKNTLMLPTCQDAGSTPSSDYYDISRVGERKIHCTWKAITPNCKNNCVKHDNTVHTCTESQKHINV